MGRMTGSEGTFWASSRGDAVRLLRKPLYVRAALCCWAFRPGRGARGMRRGRLSFARASIPGGMEMRTRTP